MFLVVTLHQLIIMVTSCIAIGYTNRVKAGSGISFHRFPLSRPELLHKWVWAVRRDHTIGEECDHLSSLLRLVTKKYISLRMKTYGKRFTEMVVHRNNPSIRHELTRTILFRNQ